MLTSTTEEQRRWLFASSKPRYFSRRHRFLKEHDRWRKVAELLRLSRAARGRLEWIIFWEKNHKDASLAARHFGISRKTFHKWVRRQYEKVVSLRKEYLRYGKMKLLAIYRRRYPDEITISAWKVRKRSRTHTRKKITELQRKPLSGFLLCLDTVVRHWNGSKRYILTAIDRHTKIAFARMYTTHSSRAARDFLYRLHLLLDGKIENVQTDNGSEFHRHFEEAARSSVWSATGRGPRLPKTTRSTSGSTGRSRRSFSVWATC